MRGLGLMYDHPVFDLAKQGLGHDADLRELVPWFEHVLVERTDPNTGVVEVWDEWGGPGQKTLHPRSIIRWMDERGMKGLGSPIDIQKDLRSIKKCAIPQREFTGGKAFILPDGSIVPVYPYHNNLMACVSPAISESPEYRTFTYKLVTDAIAAGLIRMEYNARHAGLNMQTRQDITDAQKRTLRSLIRDSQSAWVDVMGSDDPGVPKRYQIFDEPHPDNVISFIEGRGLSGLGRSFSASKVTRSTRKGKKYKVKVCKKKKCKTIHFGAKGYRIAPGTKKGDNYCARSAGIKGAEDPMTANYWSRRMWGCEGKKSIKWKALEVPS